MRKVTDENLHGVAGYGQPLGIECSCQRRALVPLDKIDSHSGNMRPISGLRFVCSECGSRTFTTFLFLNAAQAAAVADGKSHADIWDLRNAGLAADDPQAIYWAKPNPYRHDVDEIRTQQLPPGGEAVAQEADERLATNGNMRPRRTLTAIPEFTPRGWIPMQGKSWEALVDGDQERNRDDPGLVGPVKIAGKVYECIGVERTLDARPTIHAGETIGLLLKDVAPVRPQP
jgi:hypothetical protein